VVLQIRVNQEDRQLIISGERRRPAPKAGNGETADSSAKEGSMRRRSERRFGKFERKFGKLPDDADLDAVSAKCAHMHCPCWRRLGMLPRLLCSSAALMLLCKCSLGQISCCTLKELMLGCVSMRRVEKGVLTVWIRKAEGARPNIKDVFID
jgi:hypothetical protein